MVDRFYFFDIFNHLPGTGGPWETVKRISPEDYDIIPKPAYIERQMRELQEKINTLTRIRDMSVKRYDDEILELEQKKEELREKLPQKKKGV